MCKNLRDPDNNLMFSQAVLRGDRVGRLANAAELVRPLTRSGCGHVAGAVGGRRPQPRSDTFWCRPEWNTGISVWLCFVLFCFFAVMQWSRSWTFRTSTSSTDFWRMNRRALRYPARRRGKRAKRSCRTHFSSSRRLGPTPTWGWFSGNRRCLLYFYWFNAHCHAHIF